MAEGTKSAKYSLISSNRACLLRRQDTAGEEVTPALQAACGKNSLTPLVSGREVGYCLHLSPSGFA